MYRPLVAGERVSVPGDAPYPEDAPKGDAKRSTDPDRIGRGHARGPIRRDRRVQAENPPVRETRTEGLTPMDSA